MWSSAAWSALVGSSAAGGRRGRCVLRGRFGGLRGRRRSSSGRVLCGVLLLSMMGDAAADHAGRANDRGGPHDGSSSSTKHWASFRFC